MAERRRVLVTGATGAQGGGVARHLLRSGQFDVRAMTRKPDSEAGAALKQAGAEVVAGEMDDVESLKRAMDGCWGVFGVTQFWEHFGKEVQQGKNLADAAEGAGVGFYIYSSLPPVKEKLGLPSPHFDLKAEVEQYTRQKKLNCAFTHVAFYYQNFIGFKMLQKNPDGTLGFGFPQGDTPLAMVNVEDTGGVVRAMFADADSFKGRVVGVVGDDRPCSEYAEIMTRELGVPVKYQHIPRETFAQFPFPGAEDLANMFEFNRLHIPDRKKDLEESRRLYPQMQTLEQWLKEHKGEFAGLIGS